MKTACYILTASLMLFISCVKSKFTDDILKMQFRPIDLTSCEESVCYKGGEMTAFHIEDSAYKLIIYIDSTSCSPCFISHMYDYEETVEEFDSVGIGTVIVFEPRQEQEEETRFLLEQQAYPFLTVVINNGAFSGENPHLPSSSVLHSFLLNRKNEVTIVGNPVRNAKIKELMLNSVEIQERQ